MLDLRPECVPSQVLNLTWFQKGAEVTQRPVWGTYNSQAIKCRRILWPWMVRNNQRHISSLSSAHNKTLCWRLNEQNARLCGAMNSDCTHNQEIKICWHECYTSNQIYMHAGGQKRTNWVTGRAVFQSALPLKDRKILGAERGSLGWGTAPDDKARRASSQHSLSHNIVPLFVNSGRRRAQELRDRGGQRGMSIKQ